MSKENLLVPSSALTAVAAANVQPGMLLIRDAGYGSGPYIAGAMEESSDDPRSHFFLPLFPNGDWSFKVHDQPRASGIYLAAKHWEILVDPSTSYTGMTESPEIGDAFYCEGMPGIVGRWTHSEAYISVDGKSLKEPKWATEFVGFRSWSIVVHTDLDGKHFTVVSNSRPKRQRP